MATRCGHGNLKGETGMKNLFTAYCTLVDKAYKRFAGDPYTVYGYNVEAHLLAFSLEIMVVAWVVVLVF